MVPNYLRYALAAACGAGAFLLTAPVAASAVMTMTASQWGLPLLAGAVAGWLGYSPLANALGKFMPNLGGGTKGSSSSYSSSASSDGNDDPSNSLSSEHSSEPEPESPSSSQQSSNDNADESADVSASVSEEESPAPLRITRSRAAADPAAKPEPAKKASTRRKRA